MKFSDLTNRIACDTVDAWEIHNRAVAKEANGESVIMLSIGQEANEVTPSHIVDAAIQSLKDGHHHYTPAAGYNTLREAIARYHQDMTGQSVSAGQVTVHLGAQNALYSLAQCLLEPGDEVILSEPYYTTYPATFASSGAVPVSVGVSAEHGFMPEPGKLIRSITDKTRVIVLNSPSNPLGTIYSREIFEPILDACRQKDIWLISDEVYSGLLEPDQRFSPASLDDGGHTVITVSSLSKSHRMTGWRLGWVVGPQELSGHLANLSMSMHYGLPPFIMDAAISALNDQCEGGDITGQIREALARRRSLLLDNLTTGKKVSLFDSGYGMFVLLDVRATGMTAHDFAAELLEQQLVATLPCVGFGPSGEYLIRIGLCVDGDDLVSAGQRISNYIEAIH